MHAEQASLFEAHVRYELDRWRDDAVHATVAEEVAAGLAWLRTVSLEALVPAVRAKTWARNAVVEGPLCDELFEEVAQAVRAVHEALLAESSPLSSLVATERYEELVTDVVGLREVRREVIAQVTGSTVYAELVSHVLYHGLKNYLVTENAVVRHVPGASSLLRMGQNAVRSATPNLEAGIDRRLLAFVASNIAETVRDSRAFLEATLDDDMLRTIAAEIWAVNGRRAVGELAALVEQGSLDEVTATAWDGWLDVRSSPLVSRVVDAVVDQFYLAHGDEPVAEVLACVGITAEHVTDVLAAVAVQLVGPLRDGGQLEAHVRRRLEGFYSSYFPDARG